MLLWDFWSNDTPAPAVNYFVPSFFSSPTNSLNHALSFHFAKSASFRAFSLNVDSRSIARERSALFSEKKEHAHKHDYKKPLHAWDQSQLLCCTRSRNTEEILSKIRRLFFMKKEKYKGKQSIKKVFVISKHSKKNIINTPPPRVLVGQFLPLPLLFAQSFRWHQQSKCPD